MTAVTADQGALGLHYSDLAAKDTENLLRALPGSPEDPANPWDGARCAETDPEAFFPEKGESSQEAKRVCNSGCPLREFCLRYALENGEEYGIWGGMSAVERKRLLRRHDGGTPQAA